MSLLTKLVRSLQGQEAHRRWSAAELRARMRHGDVDGAAAAIDRLSDDTPQRDIVLQCLRGELAFFRRQDDAAERCFRTALAVSQGSPDAHLGLSLVLQSRGDIGAAVKHAQFAAHNAAALAPAWAQLGLCNLELGNFVVAGEALERATHLDPDDKHAWFNFAIAMQACAELDRARTGLLRVLALDPQHAQARDALQQLEREMRAGKPPPQAVPVAASETLQAVRSMADAGDLQPAIEACERLSAERQDDGSVVVELHRLYRDAGDPRSGIDALQAFHARHPQDAEVAAALGCALVWARRPAAAEPLLAAALQQRPDDPALLAAMAEVHTEGARYPDAAALLRRAAALDPTVERKGMLANALIKVYAYEEAGRLYDEIVAERPALAGMLEGIRVYSLMYLGHQDEALAALDQSIRDNPNEPTRRFPRASILLQNERYAEGWDDYALRHLASAEHQRLLAMPEWQGEPLVGKSILVLAEQGLGDQVMFASCLPDLLRLGPTRVVVEAVDRVAPTLARSFPACEVVATRQDTRFDWIAGLGPLDLHVHMGDLPRFFRRSRAAFPDHGGYLVPDPARVAHWRAEIDAAGHPGRPRIGLTWRGGIDGTRKGLRTVDVAQLAPLVASADADWVCLQYGDVDADLARAAAAGAPLHYWPEAIRDLDEFAALVSALDLVITVCNTTVHYAGALARPVWVMAPKVPEWRYGLHFESMPWYPSSRMFRQADHGHWDSVFAAVEQALAPWVARFVAAPPAPS
jgi:tetratricopeptide (TPR) repeat protein